MTVINNVSRKLLERASNLAFQTQHYPLHEELRTLLSAALAMWNSESNMDNEAADAEEALFNYYLYEKSE